MGLKRFQPSELVLTRMEAWQVLVYFFGGNASSLPGWLTDEDRSFAQALLIEAIDASYKMSWVQTLFTSTAKPGASIQSILAKLALKAAKDWFSRGNAPDLKNPKIYQSVKDSLTRNWRSVWKIRIETGEYIGY